MSTWTGVNARRGGKHRALSADRFAAARTERERLGAAFDAWRSAVAHLHRRRVPRHLKDTRPDANQLIADQLLADMIGRLRRDAEAIDRGEHDAR